MIKYITRVLLFIISWSAAAQDFSTLWEGHFSYYNIIDVAQGDNKIFAASENAIFSYDIDTNDIETITTVEGLSGELITTIKYSEAYHLLLIGYENGLIEVLFNQDNEVLPVVDILQKETISPVNKKINHFYEYEGLVYISTDYGVSVYDLERLEFGDTYFIGIGGSQIKVSQTTVFDGFIYTASLNSSNGIKKADINNLNLIDYQQWQTIQYGGFSAIQTIENKLYAVRNNKIIYEVMGNTINPLFTYTDTPLDTRVANNSLMVTTKNDVFVYDSDFNLVADASVNAQFDTDFTSATITDNHIYIGTVDFGVLNATIDNPLEYEVIRPEGPLKNTAFKIEAGNGDLWVSYGQYTLSYNPAPVRSYGISHYVEDSWHNIPYDSLLGTKNLNYMAINPFNPNQVFASSFLQGILEINNEIPTVLYNHTNSGLEHIVIPNVPSFVELRMSGLQFDRNGILWGLSNRVDRPLVSYSPSTGDWQDYSFQDVIPSGLNDELGFSDVVVDGNGTKWVAGFFNGVIGFNENAGNNVINRVYTLQQNMPASIVKALAVDTRNQLWIGTIKGLRVLYNTSNFFNNPNPSVSEIVILENDIPTELLSNQYITDIKVDGSNNKWVGTLDSGVFYFSPDGQETIYHFTTDNSPLPSNIITDISIDAQNGKVFIATDKGLVSFLAGGSKPEAELIDAYVYPNPVRPEYNILGNTDLNNINNGVKIKGLTENVNIKITDIEGNLVGEAQSRVNLRSSNANYNFAIDGGTAIWNGKNLANNVVASGVYLILISDLDSFETKVLKLLIIR